MSPTTTTASAPLATTRHQRQPPPRRGQLVVSTVDYRSLSDAATEAAVRTAHAAAALQKQQQQQPSTVSRVVTKEAFPTAEEDSGGGGREPGGPTHDVDAPTFDSFEFSFDGGGDDDLTDQLDASLVALIEDRAQAPGQPPTAEGTTDPPPEPGAAHGGRRRPRRNKNGTFQKKSPAPPSRTEPQRSRPRIVSAGSSAASLSPRGSPPPSPVAGKAEGRAPPPVEGTQRPPQRPGKTFLYAASSVVAADPNDEPARPSPGNGRRRARRASDSDEEYLPGSELRQYASTSRRRHKKSPGGGRRPTPVTSDDDPNTGNHANPPTQPLTTTYDMPASSRQSENTGRWTAEEHRLFLQGLERHGKGWKKIATLIKSRTVVQIRTHAQKYFQKLAKARQSGAVDGHAALGVSTAEAYDGPAGARAGGAGGNMSIGTDPTSLAAAAGGMTMTTRGRRRRSAHGAGAPGSAGSTKRRSIGNVVRSSVREGRTAKRLRSSDMRLRNTGSDGLDDVDEELVLPAVGTMLGHYVDHPPPAAAAGTSAAPVPVAQQQEGSGGGRERKVTTAGHGTLTQAALEDAM